MLTSNFIISLLRKGYKLTPDPARQFMPQAAAATSFFKFPCAFNPETKQCKANRHTERCCCINCSWTVGHLGSSWPNNLKLLASYAKHYNKDTGFWRADKGCILPRHMRSITCAYYVCHDQMDEFAKINSSDIVTLCKAEDRYLNGYHENGPEERKKFEKAVFKFTSGRMIHWNMYHNRFDKIIKIETAHKPGYTFGHTKNCTVCFTR